MRLATLQTGTKLLASFGIISLLILLISAVALWRLQAADALTADLVGDKLAKQQLVSDLLGIERLNGSRTVSIARSDSLELADYFQAQLLEGRKGAADIEARLGKLHILERERALIQEAAQHKALLATIQAELFRAKESGQTQVVEELVSGGWQQAYRAQEDALEALLAFETAEAHRLAG
ncbi:MCP four helix bundle domain-containing protein [Massilia sp. ST3]|uniref:MCP four helix bundle domain-containing protein n=1 Tax=Massilia sp. ST3 TaxID=2824903 RepID=UPI001E46E018|nr:MCP four helix bundle domain-containing protein [Massilia sp. ST3]